MPTYRLRLDKRTLDFSSAHFLTLNATRCARLHGHNYQVTVVIDGVAGDDGCVVDFSDVKRIAAEVSGELDHRVLVPARNPVVTIEEDGEHAIVSFFGKTYQFPRAEIVLLPVPNTTAECLAGWYAARLAAALVAEARRNVLAVEVQIAESAGQSAEVRYDVATSSAVTITAA